MEFNGHFKSLQKYENVFSMKFMLHIIMECYYNKPYIKQEHVQICIIKKY